MSQIIIISSSFSDLISPNPQFLFLFSFFFIVGASTSNTMLNSSSNSKHSCLVLDSKGKAPKFSPLIDVDFWKIILYYLLFSCT